KDKWYEDVFVCEKNLYELRKTLSDNNRQRFQPKIKELEKKIQQLNGEMPRFNHLVKAFGEQVIKPTLQATLVSLCADKNITQEERKRDRVLFGCNEFESYAIYTKRIIKAE